MDFATILDMSLVCYRVSIFQPWPQGLNLEVHEPIEEANADGCGSRNWTAGFSPCFHLPEFIFGVTLFLTWCHVLLGGSQPSGSLAFLVFRGRKTTRRFEKQLACGKRC